LARLQLLGADLSIDRLFGLVEIFSDFADAAKSPGEGSSHLATLGLECTVHACLDAFLSSGHRHGAPRPVDKANSISEICWPSVCNSSSPEYLVFQARNAARALSRIGMDNLSAWALDVRLADTTLPERALLTRSSRSAGLRLIIASSSTP